MRDSVQKVSINSGLLLWLQKSESNRGV